MMEWIIRSRLSCSFSTLDYYINILLTPDVRVRGCGEALPLAHRVEMLPEQDFIDQATKKANKAPTENP